MRFGGHQIVYPLWRIGRKCMELRNIVIWWLLACLVVAMLSPLFFYCFNNLTRPCCSDIQTHFFTKILGEKHGYNNDYENADVGIWLLDKEVDKWGIELMMETPHIKWCFQFKK